MIRVNYYDCLEMLIADIMYDHQVEYHKLFSESGLLYLKNPNFDSDSNLNVITSSAYYDVRLEELYGIKILLKTFSSIQEYQNEITKNVKNKNFIVELDNYFLPYTKAYKKKHIGHALRISDENQDEYLVCDNYYGFNDWIKKGIILRAIEEFKNLPFEHTLGPLMLFDFSTKYDEHNNKCNMLKKNFYLMTDESTYQINESMNELEKYIGICGIKKMREDFVNQLLKDDYFSIEELSAAASAIARSRRQTSDYFNLSDYSRVGKYYYKSYSNWSILAVLLMKIYVTEKQDLGLKELVIKQYNNIIEHEKDLISINKEYGERYR